MRRFARVSSFVCLALLFVLHSALAAPQQERRLALVIGNSAYKSAPLKNPVNDARDMHAALKKLGFEATLLTDATMQQMESAVREFGLALRQGGLGLFYYAGHGVQVGGNNYLVPVNAVIQSESDVKYGCLDAGLVLGKMEDAGNGLNLVILDACRNNPFARSFRSAEQGLAKMDAPTGSLIAYATAPGRTAADGEGKNGLYTQHLLRNINTPGLSVEELFKRVRQGVAMDSAKKQVPWEASSLIGQFSFAGGVQTASLGAPPSPQPAPVFASATPAAHAQPAQLAQAEPRPQLAPAPTPEETKLIEAMREKGGRELVLKLAKPLAARGSIYGRFALGWSSEDRMQRNQATTLAANQGIPLAMVHLAEFLANHPLSPEDGAEARMWLRKALALGEPDAKYRLGAMLIEGKGGPRDVAAGERLFSEAARERLFFYTAIGDYYWEEAAGKTLPKAQADAKGLAYFQRAIDLGDTYAMTSLAGAYQSGEHVAENEKEAERLYTLAANTGDSNNMYYLGKFLARKNKPLAARWYKKAAQLGNTYAAAALGRMCRDGEGIPKDIPQALALFRGAAEQGDGESQHELGQMYEQGLGVPKSIPQAYYWYVLSGELWGKHELERLDAQLAPAERVKIKAQAAKWKPSKAR